MIYKISAIKEILYCINDKRYRKNDILNISLKIIKKKSDEKTELYNFN